MSEQRDAVEEQARFVQQLNPEWRWGQTLFNVTDDLYPDLANKVAGTMYDPFNQDLRADGFLDWIDREMEADPRVTSFERFGPDEDPVLEAVLTGNAFYMRWCEERCDYGETGQHLPKCEIYPVRAVDE
jgi:hypothetical protein